MERPSPEACNCLRRGSMTSRNRAGESTEPCFAPLWTWNSLMRESHTQPHPTFPPTYQSLMIRQVLPATPASRSLVSSIGYSTEVESLTQVIETHENLISIIQILSYDLLCGKDSISTGHLLSVGSLVNMGTPTSENTAASLPRIKNSRTFANIGVLSIIEASAVWKAM